VSITVPPPAATPPPVTDPTARDQEVLVRHLAQRTRAKLAGDAPEMATIVERRPSMVLQLGVLPPLLTPDADSLLTPEQYSRERNRPPSHLGLTFFLEPAGDTAQLDFEAQFLYYVQRHPDRALQRRAQGDDDGRSEDGDDDGGDGDGDGDEQGDGGQSSTGETSLVEVFERQEVRTERIRRELDVSKKSGRLRIELDQWVDPVLGPVLRDAGTVYPFQTSGLKLPNAATDGSEADYRKAIRDAEFPDIRTKRPHDPPKVVIEVDWRRTANGTVRVQVALWNKTLEPPRTGKAKAGEPPTLYRERHLFDARLRVVDVDAPFVSTRFRETPDGFRYDHLRDIECIGINCVGRRLDEHPDAPLGTDTFPLYRQDRIEQNDDPDVLMTFAELAGPDPVKALRRIAGAMDDFEAQFAQVVADWPHAHSRDAVEQALKDFRRNDIEAFKLGIRCLREDARLLFSFRAANQVFYNIDSLKAEPFETWRLFQVVFQVIQLAALRARETDPAQRPEVHAQLDVCDVLHFSTGGGKTEAYLGLIVMNLFYDRLRGKQRGVTAMLRFPLRMLSVQQLQRILDVLWFAERYRRELVAQNTEVDGGTLDGDAFMLGYWVGRGNTPNSLVDTRPENESDNIRWWQKYIAAAPDEGDDKRIVTLCPNPACNGGDVKLVADVDSVRLLHRCRSCGGDLPLAISDDEVYRYLPAVLVCTVDKLAHLGRADQFVGVFGGPAYRCPKHNYFNNHTVVWGKGGVKERDDRCLAGHMCTLDASQYEVVGPTHDAGPSLHIQDELHLLEEELGSLDAHYETLFEVLATDLGGLPPKMLAATATIEAYAEQVRQLYAREGRVFPSPGWDLGSSFYIRTTDAARRLYFGALPHRTDPAEFGERIQSYLHGEVIAMQEDPAAALATLHAQGLDAGRDVAWLAGQLLHYELTLGYVNRKQDAERIAIELAREQLDPTGERVEVEWLVADHTSLARISQVLNTIETQYRDEPDRVKRLRALVATSIVSHGVDLNALNLMVMNGMTPSVAGYVQASSRSGRTHVGLVIVGFDRRKARERSFYQYFPKYHQFLDRLINPVPVNRFAKYSVKWTLPGIIAALLIQAYQRERMTALGLDARKPKAMPLTVAKEARTWLGSAEPPTGKEEHVKARVLRALGLGKLVRVFDESTNTWVQRPVFDPIWEGSLREAVEQVFAKQMNLVAQTAGEKTTSERFSPRPLSAFRSVDEPMEFAALGAATAIEHALTESRTAGRRGGSSSSTTTGS
jgi:hypothetical protein